MSRPAITWLITDTHFNHLVLERAGVRPVGSTEMILKRWRHAVAVQDTTIHLGDVILYSYPDLASMLNCVSGKKLLVMGNHDRKPPGWYERQGFNVAAEALLIRDVYLTHKPCQQLPTGARINVHGHWHDNEKINPLFVRPPWYSDTTHRLLALEHTGYSPVKFEAFCGPFPVKEKEPTHGSEDRGRTE